jgi:hypothetical protein
MVEFAADSGDGHVEVGTPHDVLPPLAGQQFHDCISHFSLQNVPEPQIDL